MQFNIKTNEADELIGIQLVYAQTGESPTFEATAEARMEREAIIADYSSLCWAELFEDARDFYGVGLSYSNIQYTNRINSISAACENFASVNGHMNLSYEEVLNDYTR